MQSPDPGSAHAQNLMAGEHDKIRAFIDAAREAALLPELDQSGSLEVRSDLDLMESELISETPDAAVLRVLGARVQATVLGDDLLATRIPLHLHYAMTSFPA